MYKEKNRKELEGNPVIVPTYGAREMREEIPRYRLPDKSLSPIVAYNVIKDELVLDGNTRQNLASFVTTWMEPLVGQLMMECLDKNLIDKDEYPQTAEIELRCVNILSRLWNSPEHEQAVGCSTIGSSEAGMLAGMALKRLWKRRMEKAGKPTDKPNLVMGANVQVCWEKFCNYWEVDPHIVPCKGNHFHLTADEAVKLCDENTIGVVAIFGSTFDGSYDPVMELSTVLDSLEDEKGLDIHIHVDAASGGFVAPFLQPELEWDFRVPRVVSINASGHKYGLVYPGIGWAVWRSKERLPGELIFHVDYLGGDLPNYALNFSRPGTQVVAQYYNFLRLGREGYTSILENCRKVATHLSGKLAEFDELEPITMGTDIPAFAMKLSDEFAKKANFTLYDLSERLRIDGWMVPAYRMPKNRDDLVVQRVVVREGLSRDLADALLVDYRRHLDWFAAHPEFKGTETGSCFSHCPKQDRKRGSK